MIVDDTDFTSLKPLARVDGGPTFDEPWQAQALAIVDTLVQNGVFSAGAWSNALSKVLKQAEFNGAADDQKTYYGCVLSALEGLVADHSNIDRQAMAGKRTDWEEAYRSTPHGQPVNLILSQ